MLKAHMAIDAAACHQITNIFKPQADHCFPVTSGDSMSAVTSERQQIFKAAELD